MKKKALICMMAIALIFAATTLATAADNTFKPDVIVVETNPVTVVASPAILVGGNATTVGGWIAINALGIPLKVLTLGQSDWPLAPKPTIVKMEF